MRSEYCFSHWHNVELQGIEITQDLPFCLWIVMGYYLLFSKLARHVHAQQSWQNHIQVISRRPDCWLVSCLASLDSARTKKTKCHARILITNVMPGLITYNRNKGIHFIIYLVLGSPMLIHNIKTTPVIICNFLSYCRCWLWFWRNPAWHLPRFDGCHQGSIEAQNLNLAISLTNEGVRPIFFSVKGLTRIILSETTFATSISF